MRSVGVGLLELGAIVGVIYMAVGLAVLVLCAVAAYNARDAHDHDDDYLPEDLQPQLDPWSGQPTAWPTVWAAEDRPGVYVHRINAAGDRTVDGFVVVPTAPDDDTPVFYGLFLEHDAAERRGLRQCPTCFAPASAGPGPLPRRRA